MSGLADIHEVFIYSDLKMDSQQEILVKFLSKIPEIVIIDDYFHFLYEVGYLLIRFNGVLFGDRIKSVLKDLNYKYDYHDEWIEGSDIVEKNKQFFAKYMNLVSVLSINSKDEDAGKLYERILHLAFEAFEYKFFMRAGNMRMLESTILNNIATQRAFTEGYGYNGNKSL